MNPYVFSEPLIRGIILKRPNRFVMMVEINGVVTRAHCPVTGNIANLNFNDRRIPCLLSPNNSRSAKTTHTVEAFSLENENTKDEQMKWYGINQNRANRIVEHFLQSGKLFSEEYIDKRKSGKRRRIDDTPKKPVHIEREVKVGHSRIDFLMEKDDQRIYIEVKSPLQWGIPTQTHPGYDDSYKNRVSILSERLERHFEDLSSVINTNTKATVLLFFMHDAPRFNPPRDVVELDASPAFKKRLDDVLQTISNANAKGVSQWQLNVRFTPEKVEFLDHFPLRLGTSSK